MQRFYLWVTKTEWRHTPPVTFAEVRDLSHTSVSIAPADYASWHDVRTELMAEAKTGFKARVEAELAAAVRLVAVRVSSTC